ncbi:glutamine synthetase family protein [Streptomyces sp. CL12]|uniref:glutamine synthetase family protein n=1 Tax=Streptomyces sp. CL12 TaxID=3391744 RepID=UPI003A8031D3
MTQPTTVAVQDVDFIQLLFVDTAGRLKSLEVPAERWDELIEGGWTLDGSVLLGHSEPGFSDLRLRPDPETFLRRPWDSPGGRRIGMVFCDVLKADGELFEAAPRTVLRKGVLALQERGMAPSFGVEAEFYLVRPTGGAMPGGAPADTSGYWDLAADEEADEVCRDISSALAGMGFKVSGHHHEVCAGQREIVFEHDTALRTADRFLLLKHTARVMARRRGMRAIFMPKPFPHLYGNALHVHASLHDGAHPLFADATAVDGLSPLFRQAIAGVLEHSPALTALGNPGVNSYKRLVPGSGTPVHRSWARHNRSTAFKVAGDPASPASLRLELRSPDPSANPYLLFTGILAAFADGIDRALKPADPCEEPADTLTPGELAARGIGQLPTEMSTALRALESDPVMVGSLGELTVRSFTTGCRAQWADSQRVITPWEFEQYAEQP